MHPSCIPAQNGEKTEMENLDDLVMIGLLGYTMWVKQCHVYPPPVISIYFGGMFTIPKLVVYDIVLPTQSHSGYAPSWYVQTIL